MPGDPAMPPSPDSQGYIFAPASGGHGYATEAVCAALGLAFGSLGARRVVAPSTTATPLPARCSPGSASGWRRTWSRTSGSRVN